jgi:hypothetical protein
MRTTVLLALLLTTACSQVSGPTAPTPTTTPQPVTAPAPVPEPLPEPPSVPVPTPPPVAPKAWHGTTTHGTVLPANFDVEWRYTTLWFGPLTAEIALQDGGSVFARTPSFSIQIVHDSERGTWIYNGLAGQASGELNYQ